MTVAITRGVVSALAILSAASPVTAAVDRLDYDSLGRLIRRVDDQNRGTAYEYDESGNITRVGTPAPASPPSVDSGPMADQRRNEVRLVTLGGTGLAGISVRSSDPAISVSQLVASSTAVSFRLAVRNSAPLGPHVLRLENAAGHVDLPFNVTPAIPFAIVPEPVGVAPDNIARKFSLSVPEPFSESVTFSLGTLSPATAKTSVPQVILAPGQVNVSFGVIGVAAGQTLMRAQSASMVEPFESIVFVQPGLESPSFLARPVGVSKGVPWSVAPTAVSFSGPVGVSKGLPWSVSPTAVSHSGPVGISKGVPWATSSSAGPVVAPLVGILKP